MQDIEFTLRRAETDDDIAAAFRLVSTIWPICYRDIITDEQIRYMLDTMYAPETIRRNTAAGTPLYLVETPTAPIGVVSFDAMPNADGVVMLHKIYLLPDWWGKGMGQQLMQRVFAAAKAVGASAVELDVNQRNARAIRAYERAGFFVARSFVEDIGGGFSKIDHRMRKELT
ncbi:MAG: GNAT family N-acetyltransferase [Kiritimatiellia bacterium]|uniref:GNAT family N-acetyltransferase n=1 Tax=Atribacter sp. TaxID=2847780 RepID=UPI003D9872CC